MDWRKVANAGKEAMCQREYGRGRGGERRALERRRTCSLWTERERCDHAIMADRRVRMPHMRRKEVLAVLRRGDVILKSNACREHSSHRWSRKSSCVVGQSRSAVTAARGSVKRINGGQSVSGRDVGAASSTSASSPSSSGGEWRHWWHAGPKPWSENFFDFSRYSIPPKPRSFVSWTSRMRGNLSSYTMNYVMCSWVITLYHFSRIPGISFVAMCGLLFLSFAAMLTSDWGVTALDGIANTFEKSLSVVRNNGGERWLIVSDGIDVQDSMQNNSGNTSGTTSSYNLTEMMPFLRIFCALTCFMIYTGNNAYYVYTVISYSISTSMYLILLHAAFRSPTLGSTIETITSSEKREDVEAAVNDAFSSIRKWFSQQKPQ